MNIETEHSFIIFADYLRTYRMGCIVMYVCRRSVSDILTYLDQCTVGCARVGFVQSSKRTAVTEQLYFAHSSNVRRSS